jgi:hypothetical protein
MDSAAFPYARLESLAEDSHPKFISEVHVRTLLVAPELSNRPETWPAPGQWPDAIPSTHPKENLTLDAVRTRLIEAAAASVDLSGKLLPLLVVHTNGQMFEGYRCLALLNPAWLGKYGLEFDGCQFTWSGKCVARLEEWQEGYEDEVYSRELLSAGVRLVVRNDWLRTLLANTQHSLAVWASERRTQQDSWWRQEATAEAQQQRFSVFVP